MSLARSGDAGVDDFGEVVRRDVGRHADGDAGAAVDDEVGDARREDGGLEGGLVVVGGEVDGVGVDVGEHFAGDAGEAGLGVTHGGGGSPSTEPKLPWPSTSG